MNITLELFLLHIMYGTYQSEYLLDDNQRNEEFHIILHRCSINIYSMKKWTNFSHRFIRNVTSEKMDCIPIFSPGIGFAIPFENICNIIWEGVFSEFFLCLYNNICLKHCMSELDKDEENKLKSTNFIWFRTLRGRI